jgi:hypothetical protein
MRVLLLPSPPVGFDFGLLPRVFAGSFLAASLTAGLRLEGFTDGYSMRRYIASAVLMGFGAMLAGGCAVGAGLSGGSVFAVTAWFTLVGMWTGAGLTDRWLDRRPAEMDRSAASAPPPTRGLRPGEAQSLPTDLRFRSRSGCRPRGTA